ncbi:hypothetical protein MMYC01_207344 [Madurella mycetomatis]|uniref:Uncharacterized protein n=1 Tax=Madurella mycetomatis TaxID=100816 RepID=A0A175VWD9_9PEZI|nr:hypothetical protein MMYC01_207344 [Madurella mycetomatis]
MCDNRADTPFCSPPEGAQFQTGDTVEITWNPSFFNNTPLQILIQADFSNSQEDAARSGGGATGFTSDPVDTQDGNFTWSILDSYVPQNVNSTSAVLFISEPILAALNPPILANPSAAPNRNINNNNNNDNGEDNDQSRTGTGRIRHAGPRLALLRRGSFSSADLNASTPLLNNQPQSPDGNNNNNSAQPSLNTLAIILPVVFGLLTLVLMAGYVFLRRRNPGFTVRGWLSGAFGPARGDGGWWRGLGWKERGYGERQSKGQRLGKKTNKLQGVGLRGKEIKVVTTDLQGLRMNAVRMAGAFSGGGGSEAGRGWGGDVGNGSGGLGLGMGTISSQPRAEGGGGNVFREEVWRQERERV